MSTEVSEGWYLKWHNLLGVYAKCMWGMFGVFRNLTGKDHTSVGLGSVKTVEISKIKSQINWQGSNDEVLMESITDWTINWVSIDINGDATLRDVLQFERCNFCGKGKWPILIDKYWQCWEILQILLWSIVNENTIYCQ